MFSCPLLLFNISSRIVLIEKVNAPMNHSLTEAMDTSSLGNKQIMANILECAVISLGAN